jgi:hypothetical protein
VIVKKRKNKKNKASFFWNKAKKNENNRSSTNEDLPLLIYTALLLLLSEGGCGGDPGEGALLPTWSAVSSSVFFPPCRVVGCWSVVFVGGSCFYWLLVGYRLSIAYCRFSDVAVGGFCWWLSFCVAEAQFFFIVGAHLRFLGRNWAERWGTPPQRRREVWGADCKVHSNSILKRRTSFKVKKIAVLI